MGQNLGLRDQRVPCWECLGFRSDCRPSLGHSFRFGSKPARSTILAPSALGCQGLSRNPRLWVRTEARGTSPSASSLMIDLQYRVNLIWMGEDWAVVLGNAHSQTTGSSHLANVLCATALLAVLVLLGLGTDSDAGGIAAEVTMGSDLVTVGDIRHSSETCGHDHKSADCSPCPSCSGALPFTAGEDFEVISVVRASIRPSHYADVVPRGIRRPPRLS